MPRPLRKRILDRLTLRLGVPLIYLAARAIGWTLRCGAGGWGETFYREISDGRRFVIAFWHGDSFLMAHQMRMLFPYGDLHIMASRSRDGALMARFLEMAGVLVSRGSTSRGGARALIGMIRAMAPSDFAALAVDAPRGPRHCVNRDGILYLAQRSGRPIVPVAAKAPRRWTARSWDRMEFPKPFSRCELLYGEPLEVPREAGPEEIARLRGELERRLRALKGGDA